MSRRRAWWPTVLLSFSVSLGCSNAERAVTPAATPAQPAPPAQPASDAQPAGDGITAEAAHAAGPPAPANLAGISQSGRIHLSWMPGSSAAKNFRIYRVTGVAPADTQAVAVVPSTPNPPITFDDATAVTGMTYTYFVTAVDEFGKQSGPSNQITIALQ